MKVQVPVYNTSGEVTGQLEIQDEVFGLPAHPAVVHQALIRQLANARQGTASSKTRGEVAGSGRKLFPQKHTGRARQGSIRAPHRKGSGAAFGPRPRDWSQDMPIKMRRLALKSCLSDKVREGELLVVEDLTPSEPKTRVMKGILDNLKVEAPALLVTAQAEPTLVRSARNLPRVKTLPAPVLNVRDLLSCRRLVMTVAAVRRVEAIWGKKPVEAVA